MYSCVTGVGFTNPVNVCTMPTAPGWGGLASRLAWVSVTGRGAGWVWVNQHHNQPGGGVAAAGGHPPAGAHQWPGGSSGNTWGNKSMAWVGALCNASHRPATTRLWAPASQSSLPWFAGGRCCGGGASNGNGWSNGCSPQMNLVPSINHLGGQAPPLGHPLPLAHCLTQQVNIALARGGCRRGGVWGGQRRAGFLRGVATHCGHCPGGRPSTPCGGGRAGVGLGWGRVGCGVGVAGLGGCLWGHPMPGGTGPGV